MAYTEAKLENYEAPSKTGTENPPPRNGDLRYICHSEDRTGGACQMSSHKKGEVAYSFYHFNGSGFGYLPNGGAWAMNNNSFTQRTYGGHHSMGNGNCVSSYKGASSTRSGENSQIAAKGSGVNSLGGTAPPRETTKIGGGNAFSHVFGGDCAMVSPGVLGMAAQELNIRSIGNCTLGSVEGSMSLVGEGGTSVGSKTATCQIGGKGVTLLAQGGPLSAESSGQMSFYTTGANISISSGGGKVYINSSGGPPKNVDDVTKETNKKGSSAVASKKVRNKMSNIG